MVPGTMHHSHEIIVIDDCFSKVQINNIFNDLHKLLDLIFINSIVRLLLNLQFQIVLCITNPCA